jgi:hypothetical protein
MTSEASMGLSSEFSLLHSKLNDFLFAQMGEEEGGAPLSVLSALTRLGVDPWVEGARLSDLPRDAAARALMPMIAMFPRQTHGASQAVLAERLAGLLPERVERATVISTGNRKGVAWGEARRRQAGWRISLARIAGEQQWRTRLSTPGALAAGAGILVLLLWLTKSFG